MREFRIGDRAINDSSPAYVIAEISHNHLGSLELAKEMVRLAAEAGASAVKFQKRGQSTYEGLEAGGEWEYAKMRLSREFNTGDYSILKAEAHRQGVHFIATAFDQESADFLNQECIAPDALKIASGDITNTPLLEYVAALGKPMIVSTGGCDMADVEKAHETLLRATGDPAKFALLGCTSEYPCAVSRTSLRTIQTYRHYFPRTVIGYSAHLHRSRAIWGAAVAHALGARIQEWHYTITPDIATGEHAFALTPPDLRAMVDALLECDLALGSGQKEMLPEEATGRLRLGKHLVASRDLPIGQILTRDDISVAAPGNGEPPNRIGKYLGGMCKVAIPMGTALNSEDVAVGYSMADGGKAS